MSSSSSDSSTLLRSILHSLFFKRTTRKANRLARNTSGLWDLLKKVTTKSDGIKDTGFLHNVQTLSRMLKAYAKGEYKKVPWSTIVKIVAALIYFVSPLDFIPDLLPILGFSDDIAIVLWVISSCTTDIKHFQEWEEAKAVQLSQD